MKSVTGQRRNWSLHTALPPCWATSRERLEPRWCLLVEPHPDQDGTAMDTACSPLKPKPHAGMPKTDLGITWAFFLPLGAILKNSFFCLFTITFLFNWLGLTTKHNVESPQLSFSRQLWTIWLSRPFTSSNIWKNTGTWALWKIYLVMCMDTFSEWTEAYSIQRERTEGVLF